LVVLNDFFLRMKRSGLASYVALAGACADPAPTGNPTPPAVFPVDYVDSYVEVRDCRKSADHELELVRVLADPAALGPYLDRESAFPEGAVVLKEQYDPADDTCSGAITQWTVMRKALAATERLGWDWQRVAPDRRVVEVNAERCVSCHASCTGAPQPGYDFTCTDP
jgi:hypothetical protein